MAFVKHGVCPPGYADGGVGAAGPAACVAAAAWAYWNTLPNPPTKPAPIDQLVCAAPFVDCSPLNGHATYSRFCTSGGLVNLGTMEFDTDANQLIYYGWESPSGNPAVFTYPMSPEEALACADIYGSCPPGA